LSHHTKSHSFFTVFPLFVIIMTRSNAASISKAVRRSDKAHTRFLRATERLAVFERDPQRNETWARAAYDCVPDTHRMSELLVQGKHALRHIRLVSRRARRYQSFVHITIEKQRILYGADAHIRPTVNGLGMHVTF
jgi:hypothetical protein